MPALKINSENPPPDLTARNLLDRKGYKVVSSEDDADWRHGHTTTTVWQRADDGTFWESTYRVSTDGEVHELRDGDAEVRQVWPVVKTVTQYVATPPTP